MKKTILINRLLLLSIVALTTFSCDNDPKVESVSTSFEKFQAALESNAIVVSELDKTVDGNDSTYTINFAFDDKQVSPLTLIVGVGSESTAKEGEDFVIENHEIDLGSFAGQDGFGVNITVLEDGVIDGKDETIYLTFSSETPSGIQPSKVLVMTIKDSGIAALNVSLAWDSEVSFNGKTFHLKDSTDLDFYLYDENGDEVTGYAGATGASPEELGLVDIEDGTYEIWVNFWNRSAFETTKCTDALGNKYSCLGPFEVPLAITYTRGGVEKTISYPVITTTNSLAWRQVDGVNTNPYNEYFVGAIEVSNGTFNLLNIDGLNAGSLRKRTKSTSEGKRK